MTDITTVAREHSPRRWFLRGEYPQCSCGYAPRDNRKLIDHWAERGIAWYDDHGQLKWRAVESTTTPSPDRDETMSCGCRLEWRGPKAHFYPCSAEHKTVASYTRQPGSPLIIHSVKREEEKS